MKRRWVLGSLVAASILVLHGCSTLTGGQNTAPAVSKADKARLVEITEGLPAEQQARYPYRHPVETLSFFGIKPGSTVVEALPGGGWYSKILLPYLGDEGRLIGVDYSADMWPHFGGFATAEFIENRKQWPAEWVADAKTWSGQGAKASAYTFTTLPAGLEGQADAVLFIRALHNLARFEDKGGYLTQALAETHRVLKPNGIVGIVQHAIADDVPDAWAKGDRGYLKRADIMAAMESAGFEFVAESDINKNAKDAPKDGDVVWRLPPSLRTDDAQKAANTEIGESNRVTLLFRKR
ncbi:MAG TPA: methyltransferase domain-containing protein [Marinagarivorans sp.]